MARISPDPTPMEAALKEAFASIPEPGAARQAAWETFERQGLPHRRVEAWKWSDLRSALRKPQKSSSEDKLRINQHVGQSPLGRAPTQAMPALAAAIAGQARVISITESNSPPLELYLSLQDGAAHEVIALDIAAGVHAHIHERYQIGDGGFGNVALLFRLAEGATLTRRVTQDSGDGVLVVTAAAELKAKAFFEQDTLAFGAKLARLETHVDIQGDDAKARMDGTYLLSGDRHVDMTSVVNHDALGGQTRQLVKGVATGRGRGVFQGRFDVAPKAQQTDAEMAHHALLLSEGAQVNAKPELMIFADDVQCAHGNTVGALDEASLFYMRSRGIDDAQARALLIRAFVAESFAESPDSVQEMFLSKSDEWLERNT